MPSDLLLKRSKPNAGVNRWVERGFQAQVSLYGSKIAIVVKERGARGDPRTYFMAAAANLARCWESIG